MLLAYVDESYSKDFFFLGALVVEDGYQATAIEQGLDSLLIEFQDSGAAKVEPEVELHGKELFHGEGGWAGVPVRSRIAIYRRALGVVAASGAEFYLRGLNCRRQRERYSDPWPPHEVVLDFLL